MNVPKRAARAEGVRRAPERHGGPRGRGRLRPDVAREHRQRDVARFDASLREQARSNRVNREAEHTIVPGSTGWRAARAMREGERCADVRLCAKGGRRSSDQAVRTMTVGLDSLVCALRSQSYSKIGPAHPICGPLYTTRALTSVKKTLDGDDLRHEDGGGRRARASAEPSTIIVSA